MCPHTSLTINNWSFRSILESETDKQTVAFRVRAVNCQQEGEDLCHTGTVHQPQNIPANNYPRFPHSVSEFTSLTGSIQVFPYVNSPDSVNKFGVSTPVYHEITSFPCDDMYK